MNNLQIEDAGLNFGINVVVTKRDTKTGRVIQQEKGNWTVIIKLIKSINYNKNDSLAYQEIGEYHNRS